jgi:hypothetical protein
MPDEARSFLARQWVPPSGAMTPQIISDYASTGRYTKIKRNFPFACLTVLWRSEGTAPPILNPGTRLNSGLFLAPAALTPRKAPQIPDEEETQLTFWLCTSPTSTSLTLPSLSFSFRSAFLNSTCLVGLFHDAASTAESMSDNSERKTSKDLGSLSCQNDSDQLNITT